MESYLKENFGEVKPKNSSEEALQRWRKLCWVVKNPKRRFRFTANLSKRDETRAIQRSNQMRSITYNVPEEVKAAGFQICADELGSIVEGHNAKKLSAHDGVEGIAKKLSTSTTNGISTSEDSLNRRKNVYGINKFTESPVKVFVTATSDYRQSLQFKDLDKEKKNIVVQVTRNGCRQKISIFDLLPGDIVHLAIGDQVPADGLFVSGFSLLINESSLTGESEPVYVTADCPYLLSGTKVQDGSCKMLITTVGMRTQWGKLMATLSEGGDDEMPLQVKLNGVATIIGKIGLFFAVITFAVLVQGMFVRKRQEGSHWSWSGDDALEMLEYFAVAVTIVVVAVPEGLPLAVTLSLAFAMKKMMNDRALEVSGSTEASTFCSGIPDSGIRMLFESIFTNTGGEVAKTEDNKIEILGTPTETALLEFGLLLGGNFELERQASKVVKVEPFNSVKKRMGVVIELPGGSFRAHSKGASEIILAACDKVVDTSGDVVPLNEESINHLKGTIEQFANEALRTLCLVYKEMGNEFSAESPIPVEGYTCIAIVGIKDPVRPGVRESVAICRSVGITVRMVTGDNINTVRAIARECGILTDDGIAIEGPEFRVKTEEELHENIPKIQVVAVTGDGTNDAPALHEADIGLAMGIAGTEVAKESADVIILDDNFSTIVTVAKWGRSVYVNIQKFVQFQLTVIVVALVVNFSSACLTGNAPLTAVQLLWVNMIMDTLGALALATEPPNDELMKRQPVGRKGNFISNVMWRNILGQSLYQFNVIWYLQTAGKAALRLDGLDSNLILNTVIFNSFVFCQVFNEISSREMEEINVFKGILKNYVFVAVLTCTVLFQIIIIEFLGSFASTHPLTLQQWFLSITIGFLGMPIAAALKMIPVGSIFYLTIWTMDTF
ncbi:hypothetical protein RJ639_038233 [Escallonia herrerae]|uniref:Calcium-transporting ATPase n=1 Tax=Escallonia herrerae TaxID=1293975 RepID=A0AA89BF98_9ASTE|nr:hypothetical protein RJ639_038233 [Escallonia herrerae]